MTTALQITEKITLVINLLKKINGGHIYNTPKWQGRVGGPDEGTRWGKQKKKPSLVNLVHEGGYSIWFLKHLLILSLTFVLYEKSIFHVN